jgi:hypothetical protein
MNLAEKLSKSLSSFWNLVKTVGSMELRTAYLDLQGTAGDLINENRDLRRQVSDLQESLAFKETLVFRDGAYWSGTENTEAFGPYCPACWETKRLGVRMLQRPSFPGFAHCPTPNCENFVHFGDPPPPRQPPPARGPYGPRRPR